MNDAAFTPLFTPPFGPAEIERLWHVRKGTFPAVGAVRKPGTTVIIEDVAVAVPDLAAEDVREDWDFSFYDALPSAAK